MRMLRRHSTRKGSMNPMPPISPARLYTSSAPSHTRLQASSLLQSRQMFSASGIRRYHSRKGFLSTARMRVNSLSRKYFTRLPPINPPAPVMAIRSLFCSSIWSCLTVTHLIQVLHSGVSNNPQARVLESIFGSLVPDDLAIGEAVLEVIAPDVPRRSVPITQSPFLIGRGSGTGNQLQLSDARVSRSAVAIFFDNRYYVEDRGQRGGILLNGKKIAKHVLNDGDVITFGVDGSHQIIFRTSGSDATVDQLLSRIENITHGDTSPGGLSRINLLLEATMLLHSRLPLDAVLGAMLDHAMALTDAERGLLLESDQSNSLRMRLARGHKRVPIPLESFCPSQTAIRLAIQRQSSVITEDLNRDDVNLQGAQSIISQRLRAVVAIPLYAMSRINSTESLTRAERGQFLGILYLDSRRPAAFSKLDRQILDAIASSAASILDNARLVEPERQRQRL